MIWSLLAQPADVATSLVPTAAGTVAIWTLAITTIVNVLLVWLKNYHDTQTRRDEMAATAAKETLAIAAGAAQEQRRIATEIEKEIRHRQWQVEDRDRLAREVDATGKVLAARVEQASTDLAKTAAASHQIVLGAIQENTDISRNAFDVGNHVNEKISSNTEQIAKLAAMFTTVEQASGDSARRATLADTATAGAVKRIDQTTQETLAIVKDAQP